MYRLLALLALCLLLAGCGGSVARDPVSLSTTATDERPPSAPERW